MSTAPKMPPDPRLQLGRDREILKDDWKTNRLSTLSDSSIRYPVKYSNAVQPSLTNSQSPKAMRSG
jgi:hypothetical protein